MIYDIEYLHAPDPGTLEQLVNTWVKEGWDLQGALVVRAAFGLIGQQMVRYNASHEYKLVQALTFESLARDLNHLRSDGWDVFQQAVDWNKTLLQWVCRAREHDLRYIEADLSVSLAPAGTYLPEPTLNVVERVEPLQRLVPYPLA